MVANLRPIGCIDGTTFRTVAYRYTVIGKPAITVDTQNVGFRIRMSPTSLSV